MSDAKKAQSDGDKTDPPKGVRCPSCGCGHAPVYKTRERLSQVMRIRVCRHCGRQFVTRERVE